MKQRCLLFAFFGFVFLLQTFNIQAQNSRGCGSNEVAAQSGAAAFAARGQAFEQWLQALETQESVQDNDEIYYIPVVVHVLHNGETVGTERNISDAQILSQIDILNQDYSKMFGTPGYNTQAAGADTRIRFCLATVGPNGQATNGIVRINTSRDGFDFNTENAVLKGFSIWDPNRYLNIWSCKFSGSQYIGYAQYPMTDSIAMPQPIPDVQPDGVVIEYRVFGNVPTGLSGPFPSYNKGRTATHEIGHYLGLIHIWGDGGSCLDNATDYCADTPPQATYTAGCPTSVSSCSAGVPAMFQNYMDYTNDACMNVFTSDQKRRMRIVMRNAPRRKTLFTTPTSCGVSATAGQINQNLFSLYPSAVESQFFVESQTGEVATQVSVFDMSGKQLPLPLRHEHERFVVQVSSLQTGIYWLKIATNSGKIWRQKFAKL